MDHSSIALACLRLCCITKHRKVFQGIRCSSYLGWHRAATALLARAGNGNTRQRTNASGFLLAPAKVQGKPTDAVKRMLLVCGKQCSSILFILGVLPGRSAVVACPAYPQRSCK